MNINGNYTYIQPNETANLRDKTVKGDIHVQVKNGYVGNLVSNEGSVTLKQNYPSSQPKSSQSFIDILRSQSQQSASYSPHTQNELKPRIQEAKNETAPIVNNIAGTIIRCKKCGLKSTSLTGSKIPKTENTPSGALLTDPSGEKHLIPNEGVYKIHEDENGHYRIIHQGIHC